VGGWTWWGCTNVDFLGLMWVVVSLMPCLLIDKVRSRNTTLYFSALHIHYNCPSPFNVFLLLPLNPWAMYPNPGHIIN
jgi:hypothetical protein